MLSSKLNEKIVRDLYLEIPAFEKYAIDHLDEEFMYGYLVMDDFGCFVKDLIHQKSTEELIDKCYSFINQLCEDDDKDIEEWLMVTFLESMVEKGKILEVSRSKLKGKALTCLEEVIAGPLFGGGKYL